LAHYRMKISFIILCFPLIGLVEYREANAKDNSLGATLAGVPKYWGENQDYDAWFQELAAAGVTAFLPYSQYQELRQPLSLGYEADFFLPCTYDAPAFRALRDHNIKLVAAGSLLYPGGDMPPLEQDPLRALLACAGEGMIGAVYSVDEPAYQAITDPSTTVYEDVKRLYQQVKAVDPAIPVLMVHGPIPSEIQEADGTSRPVTQFEIDAYLEAVKKLSDYADIIAFDLYPIPEEIAQFPAPDSGVEKVGYADAFPSYLEWLAAVAGSKPYFLVLQAFSFERQVTPEIAQTAKDAGFVLRAPTEIELQDMACLSYEGGASEIAWWGQSFLIEADSALWDSVLTVTQNMTSDPAAYCKTRTQILSSMLLLNQMRVPCYEAITRPSICLN
jgi:hypothetical protein